MGYFRGRMLKLEGNAGTELTTVAPRLRRAGGGPILVEARLWTTPEGEVRAFRGSEMVWKSTEMASKMLLFKDNKEEVPSAHQDLTESMSSPQIVCVSERPDRGNWRGSIADSGCGFSEEWFMSMLGVRPCVRGL